MSERNSKYDPSYAQYIEHSVLKPDVGETLIKKFCDEAIQYGFATVAINPTNVKYAAELLKGTRVSVCCAIGFPLGTSTTFVKVAEAIEAIKNGAREVDMVINIGALKDKKYDYVQNEINAFVQAAHPVAVAKIILETFLLTDKEKVMVCEMAAKAGADYVKTCTGFNGGQATVEDITLMKKTVGDTCKIKASTGVNNREILDTLMKAGATRFGTSKGIKIINGEC
ncbi:MAG: deoxyribose-phosphate aldolase [Flexilinea sp.]